MGGMADADCPRPPTHPPCGHFTLNGCEHLGITHTCAMCIAWDNCCNGHRSCPRSAANLVDTDNDTISCGPALPLDTQCRIRHRDMAPSLRHPWLRCVRTSCKAPSLRHPWLRCVRTSCKAPSLRHPWLRCVRTSCKAPSLRHPWLRCVRTLSEPTPGVLAGVASCNASYDGERETGHPRRSALTIRITVVSRLRGRRLRPRTRPSALPGATPLRRFDPAGDLQRGRFPRGAPPADLVDLDPARAVSSFYSFSRLIRSSTGIAGSVVVRIVPARRA